MGAWEHFKKMPLGVKIFFAFTLLGIILNVYYFSPIGVSVIFLVIGVWGLWKGKKIMEKIYLAGIVLAILQIMLITVVFPNYQREVTQQLFDKQLHGAFTAQEEEQMIQQTMAIAPIMGGITVIGAVIIWHYVRQQKDYFVN